MTNTSKISSVDLSSINVVEDNTNNQPKQFSYVSEGLTCDKFSTDEMKEVYLFGIDLSDSQGNPFPKHILIHHINSAIAYAERVLGIQLNEVEETEVHDYILSDYMNWGYIQLWKRPVKEVKRICLTYGNKEGFILPNNWVKLEKEMGQIQIFPSEGSAESLVINSYGNILGLQGGWNYAPQMWKITYIAGMDIIPADLYELIYKKAVISILQVWGDLILGAGIASQSISIDGVSQAIGTTQSAMYGGASARCLEYRNDIDRLLPPLQQRYIGLKMTVI